MLGAKTRIRVRSHTLSASATPWRPWSCPLTDCSTPYVLHPRSHLTCTSISPQPSFSRMYPSHLKPHHNPLPHPSHSTASITVLHHVHPYAAHGIGPFGAHSHLQQLTASQQHAQHRRQRGMLPYAFAIPSYDVPPRGCRPHICTYRYKGCAVEPELRS